MYILNDHLKSQVVFFYLKELMPDIKSSPISEPVLDLDLPDERISDQENEAEDKTEEPKIQRTIVRFYMTCMQV